MFSEGLNKGLVFTLADRYENIRRVAEVYTNEIPVEENVSKIYEAILPLLRNLYEDTEFV